MRVAATGAAGVPRRRAVRLALGAVIGLGLCAAAMLMLAAPRRWYDLVPGVASSGPFNAHFVRDLGCANLVAGAALLVDAFGRGLPASALAGAAAFLALHAGVHLWELSAAGHDAGRWLVRDLSTVYLPAVVAVWIAVHARMEPRSRAVR